MRNKTLGRKSPPKKTKLSDEDGIVPSENPDSSLGDRNGDLRDASKPDETSKKATEESQDDSSRHEELKERESILPARFNQPESDEEEEEEEPKRIPRSPKRPPRINKNPNVINYPLVSQGIPHLSVSFKKKEESSSESESSESEIELSDIEAEEETQGQCADAGDAEGTQPVKESKDPVAPNPVSPSSNQNVSMGYQSLQSTVENNPEALKSSQNGDATQADSNEVDLTRIDSKGSENDIEEIENDAIKIISEKAPKPEIEYISTFSGEGTQKINQKVASTQKTNQKVASTPVTEKICKNSTEKSRKISLEKPPDAKKIEEETKKYYEEMGAVPDDEKVAVNKGITPQQVAKITSSYPLVNPQAAADLAIAQNKEMQEKWAVLHQHWTYCQENPYDFDGWTKLLAYVETMDNIETARSAFEGFLPLYPYCFAYWLKFSDLELKFTDLETSVGVLFLGSKSVPFCIEIWMSFISKFVEHAAKEKLSDDLIRGLYEFALENVGLSWNSSSVWTSYIAFEKKKENLLRAFNLYRRLLRTPTKLYSKHWDGLLVLVRDYHARNFLSIDEYTSLKKSVSDLLKIKFYPPSLEAPTCLLKVSQPEDKIHMTIKEKVLASLIPIHERNEKESERRIKFEEKIKRPYFHVKALEKKQLKNWREYIDFEVKNSDPVRIITLFERCLVPCAMYEDLWCKYTSFLECHVINVLKGKYKDLEYRPGCFEKLGQMENGSENKPNGEEKQDKTEKIESESVEIQAKKDEYEFWQSSNKQVQLNPDVKFELQFVLNKMGDSITAGSRILNPPPLTPNYILNGMNWEDVRQVYRRAAWIHCPSKPFILMQWAEFEESQDNVQTARDLLNTVLTKHPKVLKATLQLIDVERRDGSLDRVDELFIQAFQLFNNDTKIRSFIAIKYARFLFKIREEDDKALMILRKVLKKDKGNIHLYHHVFDVCSQRRPIDINGVLASAMLAIASKELSLKDKFHFCAKRKEFLREHGTVQQIKEADAEMKDIRARLDKDKPYIDELEEAERKKEIAKDRQEAIKLREDIDRLKMETEVHKSECEIAKIQANQAIKQAKTPVLTLKPATSLATKKSNLELTKEERKKIRRKEKERLKRKREKEKAKKKSSSKKRKRQLSDLEKSSDSDDSLDTEKEAKSVKKVEIDSSSILARAGNLLTEQQLQQLKQLQELKKLQQEQQIKQQQQSAPVNESYQAVPPSWDLSAPGMSKYGYAGASDILKDGQKSLYEKYYELIKSGYPTDPNQMTGPDASKVVPVVQNRSVILNENSQYLPPPPVPRGILGDSLFYHGKENSQVPGSLGPNPRMDVGPGPRGPASNFFGAQPNILGSLPFKMNPIANPAAPPINRNFQMPPNLPPIHGGIPNRFPNAGSLLGPIPSHAPTNSFRNDQNMAPVNDKRDVNFGDNRERNFNDNRERNFNENLDVNFGDNRERNFNDNRERNFNDNRERNFGDNREWKFNENRERNFNDNRDRNFQHIPRLIDGMANKRSPKRGRGRGRHERSPKRGRGRGDRGRYNRDRSGDQHEDNTDVFKDIALSNQQQHGKNHDEIENVPPPPGEKPPLLPVSDPNAATTGAQVTDLVQNLYHDAEIGQITNMPPHILNDGGEVFLGETENGRSIIKYWPNYMTTEGHENLYTSLRSSVKWFQRKYLSGEAPENKWMTLPKLLSWIGPCNYEKDGILIPPNQSWPPEVVDLLHRLMAFSKSSFNSCLMSLYTGGHSYHSWHTEAHEALSKNPTTAVVSLGTKRVIEMKRKDSSMALKLTLLPGSLLIMEGATHQDWLMQIPKDMDAKGVPSKGDRIALSFRTMLMIKGVTV